MVARSCLSVNNVHQNVIVFCLCIFSVYYVRKHWLRSKDWVKNIKQYEVQEIKLNILQGDFSQAEKRVFLF